MNPNISVRPYRTSDADDVRRICLETCSDSFLLANEDILYTKYADYYINEEPDNVFILADDTDRAQGYVLCSSRPEFYRRRWKEEYRKRISGRGVKMPLFQSWVESEFFRMAKRGYPAHLHIDISPDFQHCGGGTMLIDALRAHLAVTGVPGVYLGCSNNNSAGISFYTRYGFQVFTKYFGETVFAIKSE